MKLIFRPAVAVMQQLRYPQKFTLIGLLLVLPLGWILNQYVANANHDIQFAEKEHLGIEYLYPVTDLLQMVQQHMVLSNAASADDSFADELAQNEQQIEAAIAAVDTVDERLSAELDTTEAWQSIKGEWQSLRGDNF